VFFCCLTVEHEKPNLVAYDSKQKKAFSMKEIISRSTQISQAYACDSDLISDQCSYLSDDSKKDSEWDKWRSNSQLLEEMLMLGDELGIIRYAERMQGCSKSLLFSLEAGTDGEICQRLKEVYFCRFRHCAVCQARRSRRNYAQFLKSLPEILEKQKGVRWVFLTLTVTNVHISNLREKLSDMNKAWHRFIKLKEFKNVLAFVRSTEITKEEGKKTRREGYAHPHFHVLMMVKSTYFKTDYVNQEQWLKTWRGAMRDDSIVSVDVRIADRKKGKKLIGQELVKSVSETLKYSVKPSDMLQDRSWVVELIKQVHKLRFLAAGGFLKGVFVKRKLTNEEMIHTGESEIKGEEIAELRYWWRKFEKRYARKK
jgi:plasmid rolling circle replication initiator protein Rep